MKIIKLNSKDIESAINKIRRRQEKDLVLGLEEFYKMKKKGIITLIVNPFINK